MLWGTGAGLTCIAVGAAWGGGFFGGECFEETEELID